MAGTSDKLSLPATIVTRSDLGRLLREIDEFEASLRHKSIKKDKQVLISSPLMDDLTELNKLNLLQPDDRQNLKKHLESIRKSAPVMHFSFSVNPSPRFLNSLISWLRREIHPQVLLQIGLEPNIGAGCILRTTNRFFDFSLRNYFDTQRELLISKLNESIQ